MPNVHFVDDYERFVDYLIKHHPIDEAMSMAIGGRYDEVGMLQSKLLAELGLKGRCMVVDIGCGSGRTAKYIGKTFPDIDYLGTDVVQKLLDYAKSQSPGHFRFVKNITLDIPVPNKSADFVLAFSLFTHLLHEETYCYLEDIQRVLKPGGKLVLSFLEFARGDHWYVFESTVAARKKHTDYHLNMFVEEPVWRLWASKLGLSIIHLWRDHPIGQTIAVLQKPTEGEI